MDDGVGQEELQYFTARQHTVHGVVRNGSAIKVNALAVQTIAHVAVQSAVRAERELAVLESIHLVMNILPNTIFTSHDAT